MKRQAIAIGVLMLGCCAAQADERPTFEVAVVKHAAPPQNGFLAVRMAGGPGHGDPAQLTYTNVTIRDVLTVAYNVKAYQVTGPDWLNAERFDITAKIAPGTTEPQFREMLQSLLAERFDVKLHHETKDLPVMSLVVGKNGPKMTESKPDETPAGGPSAPGANFGGGANSGGGPVRFSNSGGPGRGALPPGGGNRMMITNGKATMDGSGTMSQLADMLTRQLGLPVIDKTGLTKKYDYKLEYTPDMSRMTGLPIPMRAPGNDGSAPADAGEPTGPTLENAVQQLGLKLERGKGPVDTIVVDSANRTPSEN